MSGYDSSRQSEHALEFLLAFDGRTHHLNGGYWIKFEIKRVKATTKRPHGLSYSFTLHAPNGRRLTGFDNGHGIPARGSRFKARPASYDHWHRTESDRGSPYAFKDVETLIDDFFDEVERRLNDLAIETTVIKVDEAQTSK